MNLRRLVMVGIAAYAGWKRLSPQHKASAKRQVARLTGSGIPADRSGQ